MQIMTKDGWKALSPREFVKPGHVPSLLEVMGIDMNYNPVKAFAEYANGSGRGYYFAYNADGVTKQVRPAINPLAGMFSER